MLAVALVAAAALAVPAGCAGSQPPGTQPSGTQQREDRGAQPPARRGVPVEAAARLDAAVAAVDGARSALLGLPTAVVTAALALDAADEAGGTGLAPAMTTARRPLGQALPAARAALAGVPAPTRAYRTALRQLAAAAAPLDEAQRSALAQVVALGETEALAVEAFAGDARGAWPAYAALDAAQRTWLERVSAGWFRTDAEAAGAYGVLVRPQQAALSDARAALGRADAGRRQASERQRAALSAADRALDGLRAPG